MSNAKLYLYLIFWEVCRFAILELSWFLQSFPKIVVLGFYFHEMVQIYNPSNFPEVFVEKPLGIDANQFVGYIYHNTLDYNIFSSFMHDFVFHSWNTDTFS